MRRFILLILMLQAMVTMAQKTITPPYQQTFDTEAAMSDFIIPQTSGDDPAWDYNAYMHCARCTGSDTESVDAYMFLPVELHAGAAYTLSFTAEGGMFATKYDVWIGQTATKAGMTRQLQDVREVNSATKKITNRISFRVEADGVYYIALHCCSDPTGGTIFVDDLALDVAEVTTPSAPTDVVLTPGAKGANYCDITFRLPTTTLDGKALSLIQCARIYRNDILVQTIQKDIDQKLVMPGATCTWRNTELSNRLYTYKIVAVSVDDEEGAPAIGEVYVGLDSPSPITNLKCREDLSRPGTVVLTWDPVTTSEHGGYIDLKSIRYVVSIGAEEEIEVSDTRFEHQVDISKGQTYSAYSVWSKNYIDSSRNARLSNSTQVGPSMPAPWNESFPDATVKNGPWLAHVTGTTQISEASWYTTSPFATMPDQNGDNGYTYFFTSALGKSSRYVSPKVDISQLTSPTLSFWLYERGRQDRVDVDILPDMGEWITLQSLTLSGERGWHRYNIDLSAYRNTQCVQVGFNATSVEVIDHITAIDNVSIHENHERDLGIRSYNFPARIDMGTAGQFQITVRNQGTQSLTAGSYTAQLFRHDGQAEPVEVCHLEGPALGLDASTVITLTDTPDIFVSPEVRYHAVVSLEGDATPADNQTPLQSVVIFRPAYPAPTALIGTPSDKGVSLSWTAPDLSEGTAMRVTDTFEEYPAFAISNIGDWTLYDGDKQFTITMAYLSNSGSVVVLDNYPHAGEPMAWQVFDALEAGITYKSWEPHSGSNMMVCMGNAKGSDGLYRDNDDWLISPALSGRAQQISFWAKCGMSGDYLPERLEVLYSTTDNRPESFQSLDGNTISLRNVSSWEEFIVSLPEGARYFALRCVSQHKFALLLDDVTYQPAGRADLNLMGYNIYRNRQRLNDTPWPTPAYFDEGTQLNDVPHYRVTAIYDAGESHAAELQLYPEGIERLTTDNGQRTTDRAYDLQGRASRKTTDNGQRTTDGGRKTIYKRLQTTDNGQRTIIIQH